MNSCNAEKNKVFKGFKEARNIFDKALRKAERQYNRNFIDSIENFSSKNPKEFRKHIKKLGPRNKTEIPVQVKVDDTYSSELDTVLHKWENDFSDLYNKSQLTNNNVNFHDEILKQKQVLENSNYFDYEMPNNPLNKSFTYDELIKVLNKLKVNKSVGWDNIPNEILEHKSVSLLLLKYFQKCFESGLVPTVWLKSVIYPIPKNAKKDPCVPLNYRGISLLCCMSKVYSSLINNRITLYCNMSDLLVDEQNGFRQNRSCEEHIYTLTGIIRHQASAPFIDLEKAFDWVDRDLLMYKLLCYGINGKMYKAILSLYNNTMSCVQINQMLTNWFQVTSGVKQGDTLSPTLFSIYINDLAKVLKESGIGIDVNGYKVCVLLYADDLVLLADNEKDLQTLLDLMHAWCIEWRPSINITKSNIVHFRGSRKKRSNFSFHYGDTSLEYKDEYKYLGIYLDEHLYFTSCINILADSGSRALSALISKLKTLKSTRYKTYTSLFNSQVATILDYCSSIWGFKKASQCDNVQNKAIRYFLGVHKFTPIPALWGEMG